MNEKKLQLKDPSVEITVSQYAGTARATLYGHRVNQRGTLEAYTIVFSDLTPSELACIARTSARALQQKVAAETMRLRNDEQWAKEAWD